LGEEWGGRRKSARKLHFFFLTYHTIGPGGIIRALIVSLLGAVAFVASLLALRHQRQTSPRNQTPAGEKVGQMASLERLRELGL
jgi:hypothetical protein